MTTRKELMCRRVCMDLGTYTYLDVVREMSTMSRSKYRARWKTYPTRHEVIRIIEIAPWSVRVGESDYRSSNLDNRRMKGILYRYYESESDPERHRTPQSNGED